MCDKILKVTKTIPREIAPIKNNPTKTSGTYFNKKS